MNSIWIHVHVLNFYLETMYCRNVPQDEKFSKFFEPKKNWAGGVLRERGLGTYTSPTLMI